MFQHNVYATILAQFLMQALVMMITFCSVVVCLIIFYMVSYIVDIHL